MDEQLTDTQLAELQADLAAAQADLVSALQSMTEGARPVDLDAPIGRLSRMDAMQQQQMTVASKRAAQVRMGLVRSALTAMADDRYGDCRADRLAPPEGPPRERVLPGLPDQAGRPPLIAGRRSSGARVASTAS